jgi:hypothetical protein
MDPIEYIIGDINQSKVEDSNEDFNFNEAHSAIKQSYSRLSTMYCMINDYLNNEALNNISFKPINLETLALKWMDPSFEVY